MPSLYVLGLEPVTSTLATELYPQVLECPFTLKNQTCRAFKDRVSEREIDVVIKGIFFFGSFTSWHKINTSWKKKRPCSIALANYPLVTLLMLALNSKESFPVRNPLFSNVLLAVRTCSKYPGLPKYCTGNGCTHAQEVKPGSRASVSWANQAEWLRLGVLALQRWRQDTTSARAACAR